MMDGWKVGKKAELMVDCLVVMMAAGLEAALVGKLADLMVGSRVVLLADHSAEVTVVGLAERLALE